MYICSHSVLFVVLSHRVIVILIMCVHKKYGHSYQTVVTIYVLFLQTRTHSPL